MDERAPTTDVIANYCCQTHRPLASLIFVAPLLLAYEGGLVLLGPAAMRNGADVWLRFMLDVAGFSQYFLLPVLTCLLLLVWHHLRRDGWRVSSNTLYGMLMESILFGGFLLVVAYVQQSLWSLVQISSCALDSDTSAHLVAYLGAGIYEELLFRLMLLPALAMLIRGCGFRATDSLFVAMIAASVLFAAAHYQLDFHFGTLHIATPHGEVFQWTTFCFRTAAGLFFSALFVFRGFGVSVGAHTLYDVLVAFA